MQRRHRRTVTVSIGVEQREKRENPFDKRKFLIEKRPWKKGGEKETINFVSNLLPPATPASAFVVTSRVRFQLIGEDTQCSSWRI